MDDSGRAAYLRRPHPATGRLPDQVMEPHAGICDGDPLDDDVIHDHPPFGCDWTILRVFPETRDRLHGRTSRHPVVHASVSLDMHGLRKAASSSAGRYPSVIVVLGPKPLPWNHLILGYRALAKRIPMRGTHTRRIEFAWPLVIRVELNC